MIIVFITREQKKLEQFRSVASSKDSEKALMVLFSSEGKKVSQIAKTPLRGLVGPEHHDFVKNFPLRPAPAPFAPPKASPIATFIHSPKRQKYFLAIRNTRFFTYLCNTKLVGKLLFMTDLRQDVFIDEEMVLNKITFTAEHCTNCGRCQEYCPVFLDLPRVLAEDDLKECISCLYCFCVFPERAIGIEGKLGFMEEQLQQYDDIIKKIT